MLPLPSTEGTGRPPVVGIGVGAGTGVAGVGVTGAAPAGAPPVGAEPGLQAHHHLVAGKGGGGGAQCRVAGSGQGVRMGCCALVDTAALSIPGVAGHVRVRRHLHNTLRNSSNVHNTRQESWCSGLPPDHRQQHQSCPLLQPGFCQRHLHLAASARAMQWCRSLVVLLAGGALGAAPAGGGPVCAARQRAPATALLVVWHLLGAACRSGAAWFQWPVAWWVML